VNTAADAPEDWSIELLRGVAALMVVYTHYFSFFQTDLRWLKFTYTGVDLFFVISGFVFAPYFFGKALRPAAFFIRRACRIYPLYLTALLAYVALRLSHGHPPLYLTQHLLMAHTLQSYEIAQYYNVAFWSLPPELEFYLLLPLLTRLFQGPARVLGLLLAATVLHGVLAYLSPTDPTQLNLAALLNYHLPGLLAEFMLGVLAWHLLRQRLSPDALRPWRLPLMALGLAAWLTLAQVQATWGDAGVAQMALLRGNLGLLAALALCAVTLAWVGWVRQPSAALVRLATVMGQLSYGVYLFHLAAPMLLRRLGVPLTGATFAWLCLACTLAAAAVLHPLIEAPCRRLGRRLSQPYL
jgi:peptidoglycan/LPS O-acetylase OafA/YrhL